MSTAARQIQLIGRLDRLIGSYERKTRAFELLSRARRRRMSMAEKAVADEIAKMLRQMVSNLTSMRDRELRRPI